MSCLQRIIQYNAILVFTPECCSNIPIWVLNAYMVGMESHGTCIKG